MILERLPRGTLAALNHAVEELAFQYGNASTEVKAARAALRAVRAQNQAVEGLVRAAELGAPSIEERH